MLLPKLVAGAIGLREKNNNEINETDPPQRAGAGLRRGSSCNSQPTRAGGGIRLQARRQHPETHPLSIRLTEVAREIGSRSSGRLTVTVFPNSQLGGDPEILSQLSSGGIELLAFLEA